MIKIKNNIYLSLFLLLLINIIYTVPGYAAHFGTSGNVFKAQPSAQTVASPPTQETPSQPEQPQIETKNNRSDMDAQSTNTNNPNKINVITSDGNKQEVVNTPETFVENILSLKPTNEDLAIALKKCLDNGINEGICKATQRQYAICLKTNTENTEEICDSLFLQNTNVDTLNNNADSIWSKIKNYVTNNPVDSALLALTVVSLFIPGGFLVGTGIKALTSLGSWGLRLMRVKTFANEVTVAEKLLQTEEIVNSQLSVAKLSKNGLNTLEEISANLGKYATKLEEVAEAEIKAADATLSGAKNAESLVNQATSKSNLLSRELDAAYESAQMATRESSLISKLGVRGTTTSLLGIEANSFSETKTIDEIKTSGNYKNNIKYDSVLDKLEKGNNEIETEMSKTRKDFVNRVISKEQLEKNNDENRKDSTNINEIENKINDKKTKDRIESTTVKIYESGLSQKLK